MISKFIFKKIPYREGDRSSLQAIIGSKSAEGIINFEALSK